MKILSLLIKTLLNYFRAYEFPDYPGTPPKNPDYSKCDTAKHCGPQKIAKAGPTF